MSGLSRLGRLLIPIQAHHLLRKLALKSGKRNFNFRSFGLSFLLILFANLFFSIVFLFKRLGPLIVLLLFLILQIVLSVLLLLFYYFYYTIKIFRRTKKIEQVLPDFLESVAINLRAGMSFDKALWNSVEIEYGVLEKEIEIVAKKVMTGEDTEQALAEFASKYDSPLLNETKDLIIVGLRSGGEMSDLIERVVDNVKTSSYLRRELLANISGFLIFITIIAVVIAPALFAISYNLMLIIQSLGAKLASADVSSVISFRFGSEVIAPEDFINYSRLSISIIAVAASLIIADLREGSIKGGVKYIIIFLVFSILIYEVLLQVSTTFFSALM